MMARKNQRPNIFAAHDYRAFLKEWFEYLESARPGFSLRTLAGEAGISVGYLPMVLAGHRGLSLAMYERLAPHLHLTEVERPQFLLLMELAESGNSELRSKALKKIQKKKTYRQQNPKEFEVYEYLSHWYTVVIRELSHVKGFQLEARWIQAHLREKVPLAEVEKAIKFLIENGFVQVKDEQVRFSEKVLNCMGGVYKIALGKFHQQMLHLTGSSIDTVESDARYILGHTLAVRSENLTEIKTILDEALARIEKLGVVDASPDTVYHIGLTAVPLTQQVKKKGDEQ